MYIHLCVKLRGFTLSVCSYCAGFVAFYCWYIQEAVRTVLKQLVRCAIVPSPIKRSVSLVELERGQTMLHWMMEITRAEAAVGIKPVRGETEGFTSATGISSATVWSAATSENFSVSATTAWITLITVSWS